jgi:hypothetical protein
MVVNNASVGGSLTVGSLTLSSLNNTPIGNITPSTGAFTTLGASGVATLGPAGPGYSVLSAGAKCDGVTDDTAAFSSALSGSPRRVTVPASATCYSATGIIVPSGFVLSGTSFSGQPGQPGSSAILCAANVAACVTINGTVNSTSGGLDHLSVQTNAVSAPTSGKCIYVHDAQNTLIENVSVFNCYDGFYFFGNTGLSAYMHYVFSGRISDAHVVDDTWPELRINQARFGVNGTNDINANTYLRVTGGVSSAIAAGPNGLHVVNSQFNQGGSSAIRHLIEFVNCTASPNCNQIGGDIIIAESHSEVTSDATVYSDSTWPIINNLTISDSSINGTVESFLKLDPNTRLGAFVLSDSYIVCNDFTYNPSAGP